MTVVLIDHTFIPGKRGVCITPYLTGEGYFKPCGKMSILHKGHVDPDLNGYLWRTNRWGHRER